MKFKNTCAVALLMVAALLLAGCSPIVETPLDAVSICTTFYPLYALTEMVTEGVENVEVHCLIQPQDDCFRSYELSDWDLYMLAYSADAVISAGNGLESFSENLESMGETSLPVAEVMYGLALYQATGTADEESHFSGDIPHLYMSAAGAGQIAENISNALMLLDEANSVIYQQNLVCIQEDVRAVLDSIAMQTEVCEQIPAAILHEALFYTAQDCGLDIKTWYERESGEMLYGNGLDDCLNQLAESGARIVLMEKQAPSALVSAIESAGYAVVKLDVMSTLSESDGADAYLQVLKDNAQAVADACAALED